MVQISRFIPLPVLVAFGAALGRLAFRLSERYRNVAVKNLTIAYGDSMSMIEKQRIAREVFVTFLKAALEFVAAPSLSEKRLRRLIRLGPAEKAIIDNAIAQGKGLIAITGHFGNFELGARALASLGYEFAVVVRNDNNAEVASTLNEIRVTIGYDIIGRGDAAKPMLRRLKQGGVVVMLPDQKSDQVYAPFFGRLTGTVAGPAVMALRTGAPIVPIFVVREPNNTHRFVVWDPIQANPTEDHAGDIERVMTEVNLAIERAVRAWPEQWLWLHDRWRVDAPPEVLAKWQGRQQETLAQPTSAAC